MTCRPIVRGFLLIVGVMAILCATAGRASAQEEACFTESPSGICTCPAPSEVFSTCVAVFTPTTTSWTYVFPSPPGFPSNAIKISTPVFADFPLEVDLMTATESMYEARRAPQFSGTICNPSAPDGINCAFFRVHGETVPRASYGRRVDYTDYWTAPAITGNPSDYMLLRAPCSKSTEDAAIMGHLCDDTQFFSQNITTAVHPDLAFPGSPSDPAGADGSADGFSDYIIAKCRRGDGDGDFEDKDGHRHHGHFHHQSCETDRGDVEEDDLDTGRHFQSISVSSATFSSSAGSQALTMVGTGLHAGLPVNFTMIAVDHGNLGPGVFMLVLSDGYSVTGSLVNGSLVVQ